MAGGDGSYRPGRASSGSSFGTTTALSGRAISYSLRNTIPSVNAGQAAPRGAPARTSASAGTPGGRSRGRSPTSCQEARLTAFQGREAWAPDGAFSGILPFRGRNPHNRPPRRRQDPRSRTPGDYPPGVFPCLEGVTGSRPGRRDRVTSAPRPADPSRSHRNAFAGRTPQPTAGLKPPR